MRPWEKRLNDVELVLVHWMNENQLSYTTPDECMDELIQMGVYKKTLGKAKAKAFRDDLRKLRDTYGMPYEEGFIRIEQEAEHMPWFIYLK